MNALRPAPGSVSTPAGHPAFGTYEGAIPDVDLANLAGPYQISAPTRLVKEKKWEFALVATPELIAACAVVDLSYAVTGFLCAVELATKKVLVDRSFLSPPSPFSKVGTRPGEGLQARLLSPLASLQISRGEGQERYRVAADVIELPLPRKSIEWRGEILAAGGPPPLSMIAAVGQDGIVNVTQKWAGLLAFGTLRCGNRRFVLDGGVGGLGYTHGYLARHTAWRWAMALGRLPDGTPLGLNLVEGFNEESDESNENALWVGDRLVPLARARFRLNKQDLIDTWRIRTVDGAVQLEFQPLFVHREERNLRVVQNRFAQPMGVFTGTVQIDGSPVEVRLGGVTEDQDVFW